MRILVFWDSIWEWYCDFENWWWLQILKRELWKEYDFLYDVWMCSICSYSSDNLINIFQHFYNAYSRRESWQEKQTIVIFSIGLNDARFHGDSPVTSLIQFQKNIETLYYLAKNDPLTQKVVFLGLTPVIESKTSPETIWWEGAYLNSEIQKYDAVIQDFCKWKEIFYIPLFDVLTSEDIFEKDWLHPNASGHKKIYQRVREYLEKEHIL